MHPDELAYYRERAFLERQRASDPTIGSIAGEIHLKLAGLYEMLVELEDNDSPTVRIVEVGHPGEIGSAQVPGRGASEEEQSARAGAAADG